MTYHPYSQKEYGEVIAFLGKLYQTDRERLYWLPGRWEYATYLCSPLFQERGYDNWEPYIQIIRDSGSIVGLVSSENPDHNAYVHTHPDYKHLEDELIAWAENTFATEKITVWSLVNDIHRNKVLMSRGYKKEGISDYWNWCDIGQYEPKVSIPDRYTIASYNDGFDLSSRIDCSSRAFGSKGFSKDVYHHMQRAPHYDPSLDLAIKDNESVVSLCTVWVDPENNLAMFEPVATAPEYQRKGLGTALLNEGLRRLKERRIGTAYVGSTGDWRKSFYYQAGFRESIEGKPWTKVRL